MKLRRFWLGRIQRAWQEKSVIWLSGVRRCGKTTLVHCLSDAEYFDCELPRVRRKLKDPESFFQSRKQKTIVLDEIHRLDNPSEVLKIAADYFQKLQVLATGSSTLGASKKFRDTLTDRKVDIWMTPMNLADLADFGRTDLEHRFLRGGLPPFFLSEKFPEYRFQDWMDSFWAKDIQELFQLERRHSFQKLFELLLIQNGGIFEASSLTAACGVSHPTIMTYLAALEATYAVHVIRPFSKGKSQEIISAPKVYGFDTGFVTYYKGWAKLRPEDYGHLWEHLVLNELHAFLPRKEVLYWRDKAKHEVDFIYAPRGKAPVAIECKWDGDQLDPKNFLAFSSLYPGAKKIVVAQNIEEAQTRRIKSLEVRFVPLPALTRELLT